jgi:hypothetical protein
MSFVIIVLVVADEMGSVSWTGIVGERAGVVGE